MDMINILVNKIIFKPNILKAIELIKQNYKMEGDLFDKMLKCNLATLPNKQEVLLSYFDYFIKGSNESPVNLKNVLIEIEHSNLVIPNNLLNDLIRFEWIPIEVLMIIIEILGENISKENVEFLIL